MKHAWARILGIAMVLGLGAGLTAPRGQAGSGGVQLNFIEEGGALTAAERREVQDAINLEWGYFKTLFEISDTVELNLRIFGQWEDYCRHYDLHNTARIAEGGNGMPTGASRYHGYFSTSEGAVLFKGEQFLGVIHHEASHFLYRLKVRRPHKWLDEGLARYFQYLRVDGRQVVVQPETCGRCPRDHRWERLGQWQVNGQGMPLADFLALEGRQWTEQVERNAGDYCYTTAWSLVHFLAESPRGIAVMEALLKDSRTESNPVTVVERNYPGGVRRLETAWQAHVRRMAAAP